MKPANSTTAVETAFSMFNSATLLRAILLISLGSQIQSPLTNAQPYRIGEVTQNFTISERSTGESINLRDYEGSVVVLVFFTQWCAPCRSAVEDLEADIHKFYGERGGNANGVPVQVVSINLDEDDPDLTDALAREADLNLVADDFSFDAWQLYNSVGNIPLLVVINGVASSPSHRLWEVIHAEVGNSDISAAREFIDQVAAPSDPEPYLNPFANLPADKAGWKTSEWFGRLNDSRFPWIFQEDQEWIYVARRSTSSSFYFHDPVLGWLYTDESLYPKIFSFQRNVWLSYNPATNSPREFFDFTVNDWIPFETSREARPRTVNGFEFTNAVIPVNQIFRGGPPRDGIPAILDPKFVTPAIAASYMETDDVVLSVTHDGETRAYPFRILNWHEVVNDQIGEVHFAATYCPLCGTALAFNRTVNGRILTFGVSGLLYLDNVLMYDHQSESLWSQLFLKSVTGPQSETPLEFIISEQMLYRKWLEKYPNGVVLSTDTGHNRNYSVDAYASYFASPGLLFPVGDIRNELNPKDWIYGIQVNGEAIAFVRDKLVSGEQLEHEFNGQTLSIFYDEPAQNITVRNAATNEIIPGSWSFWFAWQAFFKDSALWPLP